MNITTHPIHPGHHHPIVEQTPGKPGPGHPAHPGHPDGDDHRHHDLGSSPELSPVSDGNPMEIAWKSYGNGGNPMDILWK